jgi:NADH-quinone oxidoreductase subunit F
MPKVSLSILSATVTRATRARLWTEVSWKAIPTGCWRVWLSVLMPLGASEGYIYVRAEYPLAVKRLHLAVKEAEEMGLLGDNILGTDFSSTFTLKKAPVLLFVVKRLLLWLRSWVSAVCRGHGRHSQPTLASGANLLISTTWRPGLMYPEIILKGPTGLLPWVQKSVKGPKCLPLPVKVQNTGLVEVPMGITMREIIFDIGGGVPDGKKFKGGSDGRTFRRLPA